LEGSSHRLLWATVLAFVRRKWRQSAKFRCRDMKLTATKCKAGARRSAWSFAVCRQWWESDSHI